MKDAAEFLRFCESSLGIGRGEATMETSFGSVPQWDSIAHLRLVLELESRYGFETPVEKIADTLTLGGFFAMVPE